MTILARTGTVAQDEFGVQQRAAAAGQMITLAVQQGISSLPPTSGQTFTFQFDEELSIYVPSQRMGPTSFRSPLPIGAGRFSVRGAFSYFEPSQTFDPIDYKVSGAGFEDPPGVCTRFGLDVSAKVALFNLAATYGLTERVEFVLNVPVVVTDVSASEIFLSDDPASLNIATADCNELRQEVASGDLKRVELPFQDVELASGPLDFNHGTNAGVGRISVGAKILLFQSEPLQIAFAPEVFFPSPSEDAYAGSDSGAVLPRVIGQFVAFPWWRLHADAGYDYDYDLAELRRFTWNAGTSFATTGERGFTFDLGVGGSEFDEGIEWTPARAPFVDQAGGTGLLRALGNNRLGVSFVDFLIGLKARIGNHAALSGSVNVPLNDEGFRADAVGTFAAEYYF